MKIELDLSKSFNNYHWEDKEELKYHILVMVNELWELYNKTEESMSVEERNKLYDILDMFNKFEIKESEKIMNTSPSAERLLRAFNEWLKESSKVDYRFELEEQDKLELMRDTLSKQIDILVEYEIKRNTKTGKEIK